MFKNVCHLIDVNLFQIIDDNFFQIILLPSSSHLNIHFKLISLL